MPPSYDPHLSFPGTQVAPLPAQPPALSTVNRLPFLFSVEAPAPSTLQIPPCPPASSLAVPRGRDPSHLSPPGQLLGHSSPQVLSFPGTFPNAFPGPCSHLNSVCFCVFPTRQTKDFSRTATVSSFHEAPCLAQHGFARHGHQSGVPSTLSVASGCTAAVSPE